MSSALVALIGAIYLVSCVSFITEAKYAWALLSFLWGSGNLVISYISWAQ